ncbi:bifunctional 2-polyprenyl-6-hydroxyphenol methylase/3-demethylubiquinol 3-O-methyltransferase UbiG [Methylocapsa sp. S129]|uniref:class I SAM-dependent methyltransferase n=1 Tax=Methylocapsa sp. S129 TaxID=1641869 RepID=UPI001AEDC012|nr:class I SAM-dependent methyltransferase [Methylocapsa sp. S129]
MALDEYVVGMPSAQNAIDTLPGWNQALPPNVDAVAGNGAFYNDPRILWAIDQLGSIEGLSILELGPLEAAHTFLMEQHGPNAIDAVEANKLSYLRCLVVKELLDLRRAKFYLGDFAQWLEKTDRRYDFIVASGVLYHMEDPVRLLELIAARTNVFYLWTHYVSDDAMPVGDPRRGALVGSMEIQERHGVQVRLRKRSYYGAWKSKSFCGGMHDLHRWVEKDDIIAVIKALGFDDVRVAHDEPDHQNGPSFSIFAQRTGLLKTPG